MRVASCARIECYSQTLASGSLCDPFLMASQCHCYRCFYCCLVDCDSYHHRLRGISDTCCETGKQSSWMLCACVLHCKHARQRCDSPSGLTDWLHCTPIRNNAQMISILYLLFELELISGTRLFERFELAVASWLRIHSETKQKRMNEIVSAPKNVNEFTGNMIHQLKISQFFHDCSSLKKRHPTHLTATWYFVVIVWRMANTLVSMRNCESTNTQWMTTR